MNCPTSTLHKPLIRTALASGLLALLAACGGGGSLSEPNNDAAPWAIWNHAVIPCTAEPTV
jgi:hypothetical protein